MMLFSIFDFRFSIPRAALKKIPCFVVTGLQLALCGSIDAQQPKKFYRIGYFGITDPVAESARATAIRMALQEMGYIEGQNIAFEYRYAEEKRERYPEVAAELVGLKVDVIVVAGGDVAIRTAKQATKTIPIVMVGQGSDPVEAGHIESLARPGGNITGLTRLTRDLDGKRLELIKEAVPKLATVAVLYDPANPAGVVAMKDRIPEAARSLGVTIQPYEVKGADDLDRVIAAVNRQRPDAFQLLGSVIFSSLPIEKRIISFAIQSRLPAVYSSKAFVEAGGLMYYGSDITAGYRRVAYYVDKILRGAKPADLPVEQPTKFEFVINLKTAKQIGLTIPANVLARADKVIR